MTALTIMMIGASILYSLMCLYMAVTIWRCRANAAPAKRLRAAIWGAILMPVAFIVMADKLDDRP